MSRRLTRTVRGERESGESLLLSLHSLFSAFRHLAPGTRTQVAPGTRDEAFHFFGVSLSNLQFLHGFTGVCRASAQLLLHCILHLSCIAALAHSSSPAIPVSFRCEQRGALSAPVALIFGALPIGRTEISFRFPARLSPRSLSLCEPI